MCRITSQGEIIIIIIYTIYTISMPIFLGMEFVKQEFSVPLEYSYLPHVTLIFYTVFGDPIMACENIMSFPVSSVVPCNIC